MIKSPLEGVGGFLVNKNSIFTYLTRFYQLFSSKIFYQKQVCIQFSTLNSKLFFSELIYHVPFQIYFNCVDPQISKLYKSSNTVYIGSPFTFCISRTLFPQDKQNFVDFSTKFIKMFKEKLA